MKKTTISLAIIFSILACHKNTMPTIPSRTNEPTAPQPVVADVKPDMAIGKTLYETRCARCHDMPEPSKYTAQRWETILSTMMPRARLNPAQKVHVTAYVKANSAL